MVDYAEKRDFQRMTLDCALEYKIYNDDAVYRGAIKNLSATGLLFTTQKSIPLGLNLQVKLSPENNLTPPMSAEVKVTRCDKYQDGDNHVACEITRVLE